MSGRASCTKDHKNTQKSDQTKMSQRSYGLVNSRIKKKPILLNCYSSEYSLKKMGGMSNRPFLPKEDSLYRDSDANHNTMSTF